MDSLLEDFLKNGGKIKKLKTKKKVSKKFKKYISKQKQIKSFETKKKLIQYSNELETNLPKSEVWFRSLYEKHFRHFFDRYNKPFRKRYIPDLINLHLKYVIEIDGSIHEIDEIIKRDKIKDRFYKSHGFQVFRVKAYDLKSYIKCINELSKLRNQIPNQSFFQLKID